MTEKKKRAPRSVRGPIIAPSQIVAARALADLKQTELARLLDMSVTALSNLESGSSRAAGARAFQLAEVFLAHGVVFLGPQAVEIYADTPKYPAPTGEGVQRIRPDKKLLVNVLPPEG